MHLSVYDFYFALDFAFIANKSFIHLFNVEQLLIYEEQQLIFPQYNITLPKPNLVTYFLCSLCTLFFLSIHGIHLVVVYYSISFVNTFTLLLFCAIHTVCVLIIQ